MSWDEASDLRRFAEVAAVASATAVGLLIWCLIPRDDLGGAWIPFVLTGGAGTLLSIFPTEFTGLVPVRLRTIGLGLIAGTFFGLALVFIAAMLALNSIGDV